MKAFTDKSKVIDTIGDRVGGESRPPLFASSSRRRQHLPTPPRQELRGSIGSSCFGCARNDLRSIDRSRRTVQTPHYEPNGSARAGEGRSVVRGRVLSQSLLVARERRRREPGYNPVIDTTALTSGEGHVVKDGTSRRVRKILAGVPASVSFRDLILALSLSRAERQSWTVGNRPIRKNDLRSLRRISAEAQIQDRSRQKTGLNTAPGFSRVYNKPPLRGAKGTRAQHAGDARNSPPPTIPADYPVIPADAGTQSKTKHTVSLPFRFAKGDASAASRGMPENHQNPHNRRSTPSHNNHPPTSPQYLRNQQPSPLPQPTTVPSPASNHPSPSQGEIKRGSRVRATGGQGARPTQTTTPPPSPQYPLPPTPHLSHPFQSFASKFKTTTPFTAVPSPTTPHPSHPSQSLAS